MFVHFAIVRVIIRKVNRIVATRQRGVVTWRILLSDRETGQRILFPERERTNAKESSAIMR